MMARIFIEILNMSISAAYAVCAVLPIRLLIKKSPKWLAVLLWSIVGIRLICPVSFESVLSLIPSSETVSPTIMTDITPMIDSGIPIINDAVNPIIYDSFAPSAGDSANPLQIHIPVLTTLWLMGISAMLIYTAVSYIGLKRKISSAVLSKDNIYLCERVASPFVLGFIKPKIYLPFYIVEKDAKHVIAHESSHLARKDHIWKPIGFMLLTLHWFNPVIWLAYVIFCRDIELACDERVIKKLDRDARADYSEALLACSVNGKQLSACPLAFGEICVNKRIKSVLNYKKPALWLIIAATVACIGVAVCFLTDPLQEKDNPSSNITDASRARVYGYIREEGYSRYTEYLYIRAFGCNVENVTVEFVDACYENGQLSFNIAWINNREDSVEIGPKFEIFKYDGKDKIKLDSKGVWALYLQMLCGKGTKIDGGVPNAVISNENTASYRITAHYNVSAPGSYRFEAHGAWVEFEIFDSVNSLYSSYDTSNGLDIYVWQMAEGSYSFGLLPHSEDERYWLSSELLGLPGVNAKTMKSILAKYEIEEKNIRIIPWQNPISSYIGDYWIINEGEDPDAKREIYVNQIKDMLFE